MLLSLTFPCSQNNISKKKKTDLTKQTSGLALVTSHNECKPMTESYVITKCGSLQQNTTLTAGSQKKLTLAKKKIMQIVVDKSLSTALLKR